jgi:hypothetical protein
MRRTVSLTTNEWRMAVPLAEKRASRRPRSGWVLTRHTEIRPQRPPPACTAKASNTSSIFHLQNRSKNIYICIRIRVDFNGPFKIISFQFDRKLVSPSNGCLKYYFNFMNDEARRKMFNAIE